MAAATEPVPGLVLHDLLGLSTEDTAVPAATPRLSRHGQALLGFEELLRQTTNGKLACALASPSSPVIDFPKDDHDCTPLAKYSPYFVDFDVTAPSPFHLVQCHFRPGVFGNYPKPIEIDGMMIACTSADTTFLVKFQDAVDAARQTVPWAWTPTPRLVALVRCPEPSSRFDPH